MKINFPKPGETWSFQASTIIKESIINYTYDYIESSHETCRIKSLYQSMLRQNYRKVTS